MVYLSGPITGVGDYLERFKKAEKVAEREGFTVVNPAYIFEPFASSNASHEAFLTA